MLSNLIDSLTSASATAAEAPGLRAPRMVIRARPGSSPPIALLICPGQTLMLFAANGLSGFYIIHPGQSLVACAPAPDPSTTRLDAEQAANAWGIIVVGRELDVSDQGIAIAIATGMVESWLRNLDWGDRD